MALSAQTIRLHVAFINRTVTITQEPEEAVNDTFTSAPVVELLAPTDNNEEGAPDGETINLIIPNSPTDNDQDVVAIDLVSGNQYEIAAPEMGSNVTAEMEVFGPSQVVVGASITSPALLHVILTADTTLPVRLTAPQTGRYYLRFDNTKPFAADGVNLRVGVREVATPVPATATPPSATATPVPPTSTPISTPTVIPTPNPGGNDSIFLPLVQQ